MRLLIVNFVIPGRILELHGGLEITVKLCTIKRTKYRNIPHLRNVDVIQTV